FPPRFLLEVNALAFVELIEAALHRAPMEEPLLPAVVADEAEAPVPNEPLDRAGRHPSLLGRTAPRLRLSIFVPPQLRRKSPLLWQSRVPRRRPNAKPSACVQFLV